MHDSDQAYMPVRNSAPLQANCQTHVQDLNKTISSFEEKEKKVKSILIRIDIMIGSKIDSEICR